MGPIQGFLTSLNGSLQDLDADFKLEASLTIPVTARVDGEEVSVDVDVIITESGWEICDLEEQRKEISDKLKSKLGSEDDHLYLTKGKVREQGLVGEVRSQDSDARYKDLVIADEDKDHYGGKGWPHHKMLLDYGKCRKCEIRLVSWCKKVICPRCGESKHCT